MTKDIDSLEINEETKHPMLETLQIKPRLRTRMVLDSGSSSSASTQIPIILSMSDAELMEKYLVKDLRNRIQRLLDLTGGETTDGSIRPTRANILKTSSIFNDA
ncbi:hypothetical protein EDD85DRAFT_956166 [Armillaria nabsnona]|nr:hypothetical protein EDD85DRAFT_956166 [Armillaria nabsnona]